MGTSNFACDALKKIIEEKNLEIVAVYTKEPKIAGRGNKMQISAIHQIALENNLKVITPKTLKDQKIQEEFKNLSADLAVVVSYGLILPIEILESTKFGCLNIHPSLLPKWRGAAPIQRTIMFGDKETSVCIIKMDNGIDSGEIVNEKRIKLDGTENYQSLSKLTAEIGAEILIETIRDLPNKLKNSIKQNDQLAVYANKIDKNECKINWQDDVVFNERKIRSLNGFIEAFLEYDQEKIKIFSAEIIDRDSCNFQIGEIIDENFLIQCKKGTIRPKMLQRPGRKPLHLQEFLLGFKPKIGKILT
jgi:methionyl-tRNA formyltransferase